MPRKVHNAVDDPEITIRLKHGIHTIFITAMLDWPFSRVTAELLSILRDRYPDGLTTSTSRPGKTPVPASESDIKVAYALPKNPSDLAQGWKHLKAQPTDTVAGKGLTDMCAVAFALLDPEADEADVRFQVELPSLEDDDGL
ncbi:hypothetical protein VTK56DRAFT_6154 [Thermocarpiscus australiensis]